MKPIRSYVPALTFGRHDAAARGRGRAGACVRPARTHGLELEHIVIESDRGFVGLGFCGHF